MKKRILVALSDSVTSQSVLDHMIEMNYYRDECQITLLHVFRKPAAQESLMGKKFTSEQEPRIMQILEKARKKLVDTGFDDNSIEIKLLIEQFPTVTDGIVHQFQQDDYQIVLIGRKHKSKSEEFVLGDISIKLVRILKNTAVVVVKT